MGGIGRRDTDGTRDSRRDWLVDGGCFLLAAVYGVVAAASLPRSPIPPELAVADQVASAFGCTALWWRRRFPVVIAVCLVPLASFSLLVQGAMSIALFTVAVHRPWRPTAVVALLTLATVPVYSALRPDDNVPAVASVLIGVVGYAAVLGWGMLVRSRRQVLAHLADRAQRAEDETRRQEWEIRRSERERIARDIHDVLAHRLSLLSVYAGALEYRTDSAPPEVRDAVAVIRERSHEALQDVREVIGVLRMPDTDDAVDGADPDPGPDAQRPPPTFGDIGRLLQESRDAGTPVALADHLPADAGTMPDTAGRAAYRIVQEVLTNARKHAPGADVALALSGGPGEGLTLVARTPPAPAPAVAVPGGGHGLIGMRERAELAGGRLEFGRIPTGEFEVRSWLPWAA